ncbi:hypothetical protein DU69_08410 [Methanosarcina mazei]|jgi:hypothetical protein|uniref:Uncharacterized protein n=1 Tax=Methanosarcina mazei TaxID=2209 RepID=A0A0F8LLA3_METMZ|nr:hypothetical protein [Methanosarcina mazei]KKG94045.1 hypothetical protein DU69_08410 [Methanosarcina mazei]
MKEKIFERGLLYTTSIKIFKRTASSCLTGFSVEPSTSYLKQISISFTFNPDLPAASTPLSIAMPWALKRKISFVEAEKNLCF